MSEDDELVNAEHLDWIEELAGDEDPVPETEEVLEGDVQDLPTVETAPEPVPNEVEELVEEGEIVAAPELVEMPRIDLNAASEEELQALPGIGGALAARIVDYRVEVQPFQEPAEITTVPGVSDALYARIAPLVTTGLVVQHPEPEPEFEPSEPASGYVDAPVDEIGLDADEVGWGLGLAAEGEEATGLEPELEASEVEVEPPHEPELEVSEAEVKAPPGPEPPLVEVVQGRAGCGRLLLVGLLSAVLGAILALGVLVAVNGTLDFQSSAERVAERVVERVVEGEVVRLDGELEALTAKVGDVEGRLQAIQALDARLTAVEASVAQVTEDLEATQDQVASMTETMGALRQEYTNLREDLDGMADHVGRLGNRMDELEGQLASLSQEIDSIRQATERFDVFLDGLRDLLGQTDGVGRGVSPLGPAPARTPSLRPMVTVIPLATPTPTQ